MMEGSIPPGPHLLGVRAAEKFGHNFSMHVSQPVMAALLNTTTFGSFGREYSPLGSQLVITMPRRQLAC